MENDFHRLKYITKIIDCSKYYVVNQDGCHIISKCNGQSVHTAVADSRGFVMAYTLVILWRRSRIKYI